MLIPHSSATLTYVTNIKRKARHRVNFKDFQEFSGIFRFTREPLETHNLCQAHSADPQSGDEHTVFGWSLCPSATTGSCYMKSSRVLPNQECCTCLPAWRRG